MKTQNHNKNINSNEDSESAFLITSSNPKNLDIVHENDSIESKLTRKEPCCYFKRKNTNKHVKRCLIALIFIISFISVLFIFIFSYTLPYNPLVKVSEQPYSFKYNNIMKEIYDKNHNFANVPINRIAMVGSHDSFTYTITKKNSFPNSSENTITNNKIVYGLAKGLILRLSIAQPHNLTMQLSAGARYIDFRITYIGDKFYVSHGLVGNELKDCLLELLYYLQNSKAEVFIFSIVHYYTYEGGKTYEEMLEYMSTIKDNNGKSIYNYAYFDLSKKDFSEITYGELTEAGTRSRILFLGLELDTLLYKRKENKELSDAYYKCENSKYTNNKKCDEYFSFFDQKQYAYLKYFWLGLYIDNHWHNSCHSLNDKIDDYFNKLNPNIVKKAMITNQAQNTITFKSNEISCSFAAWSLIDLSYNNSSKLMENELFEKWFEKMPIVLLDWVTNKQPNEIINEKIKKFNLDLAKKYT